jgi:hypothetical protein
MQARGGIHFPNVWACGKVEQLESVVEGDSAAPQKLADGGGRKLAETLRINTTLASLDLWGNCLGDAEGGRWQRHWI